jgi:hypothetical protein
MLVGVSGMVGEKFLLHLKKIMLECLKIRTLITKKVRNFKK